MSSAGRWWREAARWLAFAAVLVLAIMPAHAHPAGSGGVEPAHAACHGTALVAASSDDDGDDARGAATPDHCLCCHGVVIAPSSGAEPVRAAPLPIRAVSRERPLPTDADPDRLREPPRHLA